LHELAQTRREAIERGDERVLARLDEEVDALERELSRAVGLGKRARRSGAAAERARSNVQRRLRDAIDRIAANDPDLGNRLRSSITTGIYCVFRSEPRVRR
jgi:hypothetical protein